MRVEIERERKCRICFNPGPERRVPIPNRYIAVASFCFCKNNKRTIIIRGTRTESYQG